MGGLSLPGKSNSAKRKVRSPMDIDAPVVDSVEAFGHAFYPVPLDGAAASANAVHLNGIFSLSYTFSYFMRVPV